MADAENQVPDEFLATLAIARMFGTDLGDELSEACKCAAGPERDQHLVQAMLSGMRVMSSLQSIAEARPDLFKQAQGLSSMTSDLLRMAGGEMIQEPGL